MSGREIIIDQAPIMIQPQWAPVPVSTDDIRDLYEDLEYDEDAISLGSAGRWTKDRGRSHYGHGRIGKGQNDSNVIEEVEEEDNERDDDDDSEIHSRVGDFFTAPCRAAEQAEEFVKKVWEAGWRVVHHNSLPNWLRDNDFLHKGHRLPTNSFLACFKSIFRVHTETGNIWTHLLGMIAFIGITSYFVTRPSFEIQWQEKAVFSAFFVGAIVCLGFSWVFHTVFNHSQGVGKLFNKLDYCGIAILTMGSFVPWLHYGFYCKLGVKIIYMALTFGLGTLCIIVSLWSKFSEPRFRPLRAGVFIAFGLSGVIPALHIVITDGFWEAVNKHSLGWLSLMGLLYIVGALIYAIRIPERLFPGKFDIWFQSHQIFHMFVLAAAFVHYHGITEIANYRLSNGDCLTNEYF
ncbi:adiponectin receptor protein-like [Mya arenaria]|uniref:adiponectin receptor protein-like n=1 Tax=Mya arenaria TaxID=6604 RepID=UPI0022E77C16|nr:adiponectin receptor protein-like [Mya arenaria]XP_052781483.1 adiponectin receptor protein-like [Mya arenaria]